MWYMRDCCHYPLLSPTVYVYADIFSQNIIFMDGENQNFHGFMVLFNGLFAKNYAGIIGLSLHYRRVG